MNNTTTGNVICKLESRSKISFVKPEGDYIIELYDGFFRLLGYGCYCDILYENIKYFVLLSTPDEAHVTFVVCVHTPARLGQRNLPFVVLTASNERD